MKYMCFQIVFKILKINKTLQTDWPNTFLPATWERNFQEIFLAESQRQLPCIILKAHIDGSSFFKIHNADLFYSTFGQAWLNRQPFSEILTICYFRALWAGQSCLTTPKKKFMIKLQLPWIHYYMQKANFLPQIVLGILKRNRLCNLIGLEYFQLQLKN